MHRRIAPFLFMSLLLLVMFVSVTPMAYSIDWSPDMRLTWKTGIDSHPSMTQTSDGRIWVVWQSERTGNSEIFYKVYNQSAVHPWSQDVQLTNNTAKDLNPSIMQAQNGTIWVVWASNRTGNLDIYSKTYNGLIWSADMPLITHPSDDTTPSIMKTSTGTMWVFWSSYRLDNLDESPEIYYETSSNNGQSWTSPTKLTDNFQLDSHPSATQAANGTIWVVFRHDGDIYYQLYNGTSWLPTEERVPTLDFPDTNPSISKAANGTIWVVWHSLRNDVDYNVYYKTYTTSWSADTQLTTDPSDDYEASVLGTTEGIVWIIWASMRMNSFDLYYTTNTVAPANDVSIFSVEPSQSVVVQGKNTTIEVVAQNKGTNTQTFNVNCYADSTLIGTKSVTVYPGQLNATQFVWNTSTVPLGPHTLWAEAILPSDSYTPDNTYTDGVITVVKHDVAIKSVTPSETVAQQGYTLQISVVVKNEGNFTENVTVTAYYDSTSIGTQTKTGLTPNSEATLVFDWTPTVPYANYTIKARADQVLDEFDVADNSKTDGDVIVTIPGDVDGHHTVNMADLLLISNCINTKTYDPNVDIDNNGLIDAFDLAILGRNWGKSWP